MYLFVLNISITLYIKSFPCARKTHTDESPVNPLGNKKEYKNTNTPFFVNEIRLQAKQIVGPFQ